MIRSEKDEKEPLFDDNPWDDGKPGNFGPADNRLSAGMKAAIIIAALVAVIAVAVAVTVVALTGNDGEPAAAASSETAGPAMGSTSSSETDAETEPEEPAMDSAAMLEGAGFDVVISGPAPKAVESWGDYRLERSESGRVRVGQNSGPTQATLDGGQWPMSMNSCGIVTYLVVFRSANENVMLNASLANSVGDVVASQQGDRGWMLLTNCATPQWEFMSSTDEGNLGDVVYDVHEYRQSASATGAGQGADDGSGVSADGGGEAKYFYYCVEDSPGQAIMTDGSVGYEEYCVQNPQATRASLGERCCGGLNGSQTCGQDLWYDVCQSRPPGW